MRWRGRERSRNVEDRRGVNPRMAIGGGGSLVAIVILLLLKFMDAPAPVQDLAGQALQNDRPAVDAAGDGIDDDSREFIEVVLRDTERVWTRLFDEQVQGGRYQPPKLVMFSGQTSTACGTGQSAMGPFYCPADRRVYIDPAFFEELERRHNAPGDFAQAYVLAHEVAHHVQNLIGYSDIVHRERAKGDEVHSNRMSVRLELQADYLAGVWAYHAHKEYSVLEPGDFEEAIQAANQIGDDVLQIKSRGYVVPERYTHGTSDQRVRWFSRGFRTGSLSDCKQLFTLQYDSL